MMVDTKIYGLIEQDSCSIYHYSCLTDNERLVTAWNPLYSDSDDGNGLSCDECGEYIFEPYFDSVFEVDDETRYDGDADRLDFKDYGAAGDLWAEWDLGDGTSQQLNIEPVDTDYGQAYAAFDPHDEAKVHPLVIWATPDHPQTIEGIEVKS